jgi:hypothetical protein
MVSGHALNVFILPGYRLTAWSMASSCGMRTTSTSTGTTALVISLIAWLSPLTQLTVEVQVGISYRDYSQSGEPVNLFGRDSFAGLGKPRAELHPSPWQLRPHFQTPD